MYSCCYRPNLLIQEFLVAMLKSSLRKL